MKLFDSHCHLDDAVFAKDMNEIYQRMDEADVVKAMTVGIDRQSSQKAVALADARKRLCAAVGIHPHNAKDSTASDLAILNNLAKNPVVRAWGEIGLDFNRMFCYLDMGFYIGITGILTIKGRGAYLRKLVTSIPAEQILIETDAPYLTPAPQKNRTRRNEPAYVRSVLIKLAQIRNEDPELLADVIWKNTCRLFQADAV